MTRPRGEPIICLVTDRHQLPAASGESEGAQPSRNVEDALVELVSAAVAAGVTMIHVRERDLDDRRLLGLTRRVVTAAGPHALVVVNDRVDVALAAGAGGVHLRGDSVPADRLSAVVPNGFVIGRSVHGVDEARAAAASGVHYLVMGTVFRSASKDPRTPIAGVGGLEAVARAVQIPVVAIGGITLANVHAVADAGAAGVAAIGAFAAARRLTEGPALDVLVDGLTRAFHQRYGSRLSHSAD
jgi:thiamine-phosphate diphosphorylase